MKKIGAVFLSSAISIALVSTSFAANLSLTYDGSVHKYNGKDIKLKVNGVTVASDIPPIIIDNRTLVPARAVFEKLGAQVTWDAKLGEVGVNLSDYKVLLKINNKSSTVNKKNVEMDVPAKIINNRTMIPVRFVSEQLNLKVGWNPADNLVTVDSGKANNVMAKLDNIECTPEGKNDKVILHITNYSQYNVFKINDPDRIVVDLPNTNLSIKNKINIKTDQIKAVRYSQFDDNATRVVLDVKDQAQYKVEKQPDKLILSVSGQGISGRGDLDRGDTPTPTPTNTNTPVSPTATPSPVATPKPSDNSPVVTATPDPNSADNLEVKFSSADGIEKVSINAQSYSGYNVTRYTDPDRIAIDIPNAKTTKEQQSLGTNGKYVKNVRYAMFDENTARVVLDVSGQVHYNTTVEDGKLVISVDAPTFKNMQYSNNEDRVGFIIKGAVLTDGGESLKKLYTGSYNDDHTKYTITFPSSQADLDTGIMNIEDKYLKSVEISKDSSKKTTSITFNAYDKYFYEIITRSNLNDTAITILKPASPGEKLVVIDPGHGGVEPGAESFGTQEKSFNLDISLRLNKLLNQAGIRTYIIREQDEYIGLYERAYIANDLNASLFICVHNNAYYENERGTETLYFPTRTSSSGFTSKKFAQIVQDNLINDLKTKNRGIVERPNLVVLKATKMPAVLAEIAFMTNKDDFALLQSGDFRQRTAASLCKSVLQGLDLV
ncbi:MAG: N-acetylmuramoyl-L-alanine amidase family protein [Bacillota bacterium]|nr:N-acetylmuramoyl-L-alanine amidase family protein [Bacillota bacterium]